MTAKKPTDTKHMTPPATPAPPAQVDESPVAQPTSQPGEATIDAKRKALMKHRGLQRDLPDDAIDRVWNSLSPRVQAKYLSC